MGDMSREPSMEEILSSIRRVIARDDNAALNGSAALSDGAALNTGPRLAHTSANTQPDDLDDVLELTNAEPIAATVAVSLPAAPAAIIASPGNVQSPGHSAHATAVDDVPQLVSQVSAAASRQSLDALAAALNGGHERSHTVAAGIASGGEVTLNQLAEAALKPMLKAWLDANLPPMVERIVAREIARITGNRL